MDQLAQHIESIVFVSESPITFKEIKSCLEETFETKFKKPALEKAIIKEDCPKLLWKPYLLLRTNNLLSKVRWRKLEELAVIILCKNYWRKN